MSPTPIQRSEAFTRFELIVVIVVVFVLLIVLRSLSDRGEEQAIRSGCFHDLKDLGLAYRLWGNNPASSSSHSSDKYSTDNAFLSHRGGLRILSEMREPDRWHRKKGTKPRLAC
jgi:hypothetical protein